LTKVGPNDNPAENPKQYSSRRDARTEMRAGSYRQRSAALARTTPAAPAAANTVLSFPAIAASKKKNKRKSSILSTAVIAVIVPGLFATVALPAYAFAPQTDDSDLQAAVALEEYKTSDAQTVLVDAGASASTLSRDAFASTTVAELAATKAAAAAAAAAAAQRAANATTFSRASSSSLSAEEYLASPAYTSYSSSAVIDVAKQYLGTPYVFGGANPGGFDCSGYIKYVFAQFGISLPHSVSGQAARGTRVSIADAVPGDVVIMAGHDGFYMGNGMIMDAPKPGGVISIRKIWTSSYYIVRISG
jgi:cell wall-associated NlpC family hydrolase